MFRKVSLSHPQDTNLVFGSLHSQFGPSQDQNEGLWPLGCESDGLGPSAAAGAARLYGRLRTQTIRFTACRP